MKYFILGFIGGTLILEPIVINFIYFTNIDLFVDLILTNKNREKLKEWVRNGNNEKN